MGEREEKFEAMLRAVQQEYGTTVQKMEKLKAEGKTKTAAFRELLGEKLMLQKILTWYQAYGLLDERSGTNAECQNCGIAQAPGGLFRPIDG